MPPSSLVRYFIEGFDGETSKTGVPEHAPADYGYDFYAAQSWNGIPKEDGRRIWIGWANPYAGDIPTHPWRGTMSLPRYLELGTRDGRPQYAEEAVVYNVLIL